MHLEITIALNYLSSYLYNKLPRRRIQLFNELLESKLKQKYYGHWYPTVPEKGSAYRCLKSTDPLIKLACLEGNIQYCDVIESLPKELCLWIDPGEVSFRLDMNGGAGGNCILWKDVSGQDVDIMKWMFNENYEPSSQGAAPAAAAAVPPPPATTQKPAQKPPLKLMTTAAFAQTKFGSTKLKSNTTRRNPTNRMSPTEFSNYIKQKQLQQEAAKAQSQQVYYDNMFNIWDYNQVQQQVQAN